MTRVLVTVLQKYFLNTDPHFKSKFAVRCKPCYRFPLRREEESPDSTEQCTGEQPGIPIIIGITESATENNCLFSLRKEGVR